MLVVQLMLYSVCQHNLFILKHYKQGLFIVLKNKKECADVYCMTLIELLLAPS